MTTLLCILALSFVASLLLTPVARRLALRYGLVDHPDGRRKMHARGTPVAGGLALLVATSLAIGLALFLNNPLRDKLLEHTPSLVSLLLAGVVICLVGVVDDYVGLRGRHKLLGQLIAVGIVMSSGQGDLVVHNVGLFGWDIELGVMAVPFTLFWLLGAINSLNLIDGMDGLLSSVGLIISLAMAAMAIILPDKHWAAACVAVALAGSLLGFLRYNFPPASIFLGDSGSMLIGLVIGTLAIKSSLKTGATVALAAPLAILTIPIFDTLAAILRRKLTGRSIYTTDRGHLHHCLLRRGLSSRRVLMWVSASCMLTGGGALASLALKNELLAILSAVAVAAILIATRLFGYAEFLLVKERLAGLAASFLHRGARRAHQLEVRLQGSHDWQELWAALTECAEHLDLKRLHLDVNAPALHEGYHARWDRLGDEAEEATLWRADIPLTTAGGQTVGRLGIAGRPGAEPIWAQIASIAKLLEDFEGTALPAQPMSPLVVSGAARLMQPERV